MSLRSGLKLRKKEGGSIMANKKMKFDYDEKKVIIIALIDLKNRLIEEDRNTDRVDDLLVRFMD